MSLETPRSAAKNYKAMAWLVTAASPFILYASVKSALTLLGGGAAVAAATLPPANYSAVLQKTLAVAQNPSVAIPAELLELSREALTANPLSHEVFFIQARAGEQRGDMQKAIKLMEEARRRHSGSRVTRLTLLTYYVRVERYDAALFEINALLRNNETLSRAILPELTKLIASGRGREALAKLLAEEPEWRPDFLRALTDRKANPTKVRALYEAIREKKRRGSLDLERQALFETYVAAGQFAKARSEWLQTIRPNLRAGNAYIFDTHFKGLKGIQPFVWSFRDTEAGRADIAKNDQAGYLDVSLFGGAAAGLAEQVLALPPGAYRLSSSGSSDSGIKSGRLFWRVTCLPSDREIAVLDLAKVQPTPTRFTALVNVPANGCEGQKLSLIAEPGDVSSPSDLQLHSVEIYR